MGLFFFVLAQRQPAVTITKTQPDKVRLLSPDSLADVPVSSSHTEQGSIAVIVDIDCDFASGITSLALNYTITCTWGC